MPRWRVRPTPSARKLNSDNTQLTAVGSPKSVLSLLQSSLKSLYDGTTLSAFTATADGKDVTATTRPAPSRAATR